MIFNNFHDKMNATHIAVLQKLEQLCEVSNVKFLWMLWPNERLVFPISHFDVILAHTSWSELLMITKLKKKQTKTNPTWCKLKTTSFARLLWESDMHCYDDPLKKLFK